MCTLVRLRLKEQSKNHSQYCVRPKDSMVRGLRLSNLNLKKIDICIESETPLDQDHYYLIGPAFLVFLPFIPAPYGVYDFLFSPRHKKHSEDILLILKRKEGQLSLDLAKAMLLRANHNEAHPVSVKCPIDQHLVTYCHVIFDSKDWSFSLLIGEIKIDGQPIIVPAIHFNRASGWSAQVIR